ncbi:MAG: hypothetical protein JNN02_07975 [Tabrizicola sp.]|nr:hypothetical protein [Tabrizicola sp.]
MILIQRNGLRWCGAPLEHGPPKTHCNRWKRWGDMGIFARMMEELASDGGQKKVVTVEQRPEGASHGFEPAGQEGGLDGMRGRFIGRTKGG